MCNYASEKRTNASVTTKKENNQVRMPPTVCWRRPCSESKIQNVGPVLFINK